MNRAQMLYALDDIVEMVKASKTKEIEPAYFIPEISDLTDEEKMNHEYDHLGFFISNHPLDSFKIRLSELDSISTLDEKQDKTPIHMGGLMMDSKVKVTKKGSTMGFFTLEDATGRCEIVVFPRVFAKYKHLFEQKNAVIEVTGTLEKQVREWDGNEVVTNKIIARNIKLMEHAEKISKVTMCVMDSDNLEEIKELIIANPGQINVEIEYSFAIMKTPYKIDQTRNFLMDLEAMCNIKRSYADN